jgi:Cytochrome P460
MTSSLAVRCMLALPLVAALSFVALSTHPEAEAATPRRGPVYTASGDLVVPTDYREWIFLSAGVDMSYDPKALASAEPVFDNVFVDAPSYRGFLATGTWPDKTQLVVETRGSTGKGSINHRGRFQSSEAASVEVHVKDTTRFAGGWAFFALDEGKAAAALLPPETDCYACHRQNAAVDTTFVQFYPTLLPIARRKATLSRSYLEAQRGAETTRP